MPVPFVSTVAFGARYNVDVVGHRGARNTPQGLRRIPESTMPAFLNTPPGVAIELDVWATRDGVLVVHHDAKTGRIWNLPGGPEKQKRIIDCTYPELQQAVLHEEKENTGLRRLNDKIHAHHYNHFNAAEFADVRIPSLEEVLDATPPDQKFYIELKTLSNRKGGDNHLERRIVDLIRERDLYDRVVLIGFSKKSLQRVYKLDPKVKTGFVTIWAKMAKPFRNQYFKHLRDTIGVDMVMPPFRHVNDAFIRKSHQNGLQVVPGSLIPMGVDGFVTNVPERVYAVDILSKQDDSK